MVDGRSLEEFIFIIVSTCAIAGCCQYDDSSCDAQCNFYSGLFTLLFLSPYLFLSCLFLLFLSFFIRFPVSSRFLLASYGILDDLLHGRVDFRFHL